ncbi:MAG: GNAT family N-acetyltransferase [Anaerosomatales bacterium]|nr:GNAT family N-acetyltransferase [Anaerosomatales bacterium]
MSEPAFSIRDAAPVDAPTIADLTRRAFAEQAALYADDTLPPLSDTAETVLDAMGRGTVLVAEDTEGSVIGSVRGETRGESCLVGRLVVEPALQGLGIGRALACALEERFPSADCFRIFTGHRSAPALHLYESLGYVRTRTEYVHERLSLVFLAKERGAPEGRTVHSG